MPAPCKNAVLVALVATLAACGDGSGPPEVAPGQVDVLLESPHGPEGALLVELDVAISSLQAVGGEVFQEAADGRTRLLALDDAGEIRFRIGVPDTKRTVTYRIIEVAGPDNVLRGDLSGYALAFSVP